LNASGKRASITAHDRGGGDGDNPCGDNRHEVAAPNKLAAAALFGWKHLGFARGLMSVAQTSLHVPFAEEPHAKDPAHGDMCGTDRQPQPRGDNHRDRGGKRHAIGAHRVQLGDLATHHADKLGPEQEKAE
jgi:hypothetical protein